MAYILLILGILLGGYALYNFLRRADKVQAQKLLLTMAIALIVLLIFVMIITGKVALAAVLAVVLVPLAARLYTVFNSSDK